jgi:hypothetical protein
MQKKPKKMRPGTPQAKENPRKQAFCQPDGVYGGAKRRCVLGIF